MPIPHCRQYRAPGSLKCSRAHSTPSTRTGSGSSSPVLAATATVGVGAPDTAVGGPSGTPVNGAASGPITVGPARSAATVTARPPPCTTPPSSRNRGSGAAGSPMVRLTVTAVPVNVRLTGITESLAVSVTSWPPSTPTVATARPWTSTATPPSAVTPAQAHAGCPGQPSAARTALSTSARPSPAAAATSVSALSSGSGSWPSVTATRSPYLATTPCPASGTHPAIFIGGRNR